MLQRVPDRQGVLGADVYRAEDKGLDFSQFKFSFYIKAADVQSPNSAFIRIYNVTPQTAAKVKYEFTRVVLNAGYENGNYGLIFSGNIKQIRIGRESAVDSYLDIFAADGDEAFNNAVINVTLAAGKGQTDQYLAIGKAFAPYAVTQEDPNGLATTGGVLPRGKVMFGMARDYMRRFAQTNGSSWSIQNGQIQVTPLTGYRPGEAVVLTAKTGMVGVPEATQSGVAVRCLLNPRIAIGCLVQIDNKSINQVTVKEQGFPDYSSLNFFADVTNDGFYRVLVVEHEGDTRGTEWYTTLTCLSVDMSASPGNQIPAAQRNGS